MTLNATIDGRRPAPRSEERDDFLLGRVRVGLSTVFVVVALLTILDFRLPASGASPLHLVRLAELVLLYAGLVVNRRWTSRRVTVAAAVVFTSAIYVTSAISGYLQSDAQILLVTNLALLFGTAATVPWGLWPQLVTVAAAGLTQALCWRLVYGTHGDVNLRTAAGLAIALLGSVYIAYQLSRYRRERDEAEDALRASTRELAEARDQALASTHAKSTFLANTSHEIRTPMNVIIGMTDMALETKLDADARDYLQRVRAAALALLNITDDLLDLSKIEAGKLGIDVASVDLQAALAGVAQLLGPSATAKGLALICDIDPGLPTEVRCDAGRLRQVLTNLVGNAIKFTEYGSVILEARVVRQTASTAEVLFVVRDTGIGIPADRQRAVFESFTQADGGTTKKYGGTGLGLTISRQLVELMGGELLLESTVGEGSTFSFTLELARPTAARHPVPQAA